MVPSTKAAVVVAGVACAVLMGLALLRGVDPEAPVKSATAHHASGCPATEYPRRVFYNRVPKAGSSMLIALINAAAASGSGSSGLTVKGYNQVLQAVLDAPSRAQLVRHVLGMPAPLFYDRHVYFVPELTDHVTYINMVRSPVARAVSNFYYVTKRASPTFDDCVEAHVRASRPELAHLLPQGVRVRVTVTDTRPCSKTNDMVRYFCGHDAVCLEGGHAAFALALSRLNLVYRLVLVLEDLTTSLHLLAHLLPGILPHVPDLSALHRENSSPVHYPAPSTWAVAITEQLNHWDMLLYQAARERLLYMARSCGIATGT